MAVNQEILAAQTEGYKISEEAVGLEGKAFQEGVQLVKDQRDKALEKEKQDKKDAFEMERLQAESDARKAEAEEQQLQQQIREEEFNKLIEDGKERGLISDEIYNQYAADRDAFWKDQGLQAKLYGELGTKDAEKFKTLLQTALGAEQNYSSAQQNIANANIGTGSPDALNLQRAIVAQKGTPKIEMVGGKHYFVFPDPRDPDNADANFLVDINKFNEFDPNNPGAILGEFKGIRTYDGMQADFLAKSDLVAVYQNGTAGPDEELKVDQFLDEQLKSPEDMNELISSIYTIQDFDVSEFAKNNNIDISGGSDPDKLDPQDIEMMDGQAGYSAQEKQIVKEIFKGSLEARYGKQDPNKAGGVSLEDREQILKNEKLELEVQKLQIEIDKDPLLRQEIDDRVGTWESNPKDVGPLKNLGNVSDVYWDPKSKEWVAEMKSKQIIGLGGSQETGPEASNVRGLFGSGFSELE